MELVAGVALRERPTMADIRRRARRRTIRRRSVLGGFSALVLVAGVVGLARLGAFDDDRPDIVVEGPVDVASIFESDDGTSTSSTLVDRTPDREWRWIDGIGLRSMDGSDTGYLLSTNPDSSSLLIYLFDGGVCFSRGSCEAVPSSFDARDAAAQFIEQPLRGAVFDLPAPENPFAGWNVVALPSSTGDLHSGQNPDATVEGVETDFSFVGSINLSRAVADATARFGDRLDHVVLAGTGAGGFGAMINYPEIAAALPGVRVDLLVDSAVVPADTALLPDCLVEVMTGSLGRRYPDDWADRVTGDHQQRLAGIYEYLAETHPDARLGLLAFTDDPWLRSAFRRGADLCPDHQPIEQPAFAAGMREVEEIVSHLAPWDVLIVDGTRHGVLDAVNADGSVPDPTTPGARMVLDWLHGFVGAP